MPDTTLELENCEEGACGGFDVRQGSIWSRCTMSAFGCAKRSRR